MGSACVQVSTGPGTVQEPHPWRQAIYLLGQPRRVCSGALPALQHQPCPPVQPIVQEAVGSMDPAWRRDDGTAGAGARGPASELSLHVDFNRDACGEMHLAVEWNT